MPQSQGSFYLGSESVEPSNPQLTFGPAAGRVTVNQMYLRFTAPPRAERKPAIVMVHGLTLTGKTYGNTPDLPFMVQG